MVINDHVRHGLFALASSYASRLTPDSSRSLGDFLTIPLMTPPSALGP